MIIPSVIPKTIHDLERRVQMVVGHVDRFHIDVADGYFAPIETWPIINTNGFVDIVAGDRRLPQADRIIYEVHLMVQDPGKYIEAWINAGVQTIIAHSSMLEAPHLIHNTLKTAGVEFGIAVTPTEYQLIDDSLFELADFILVMGSDKIGYHGVELSDESIEIIKKLRKHTDKDIGVDIGVNKDTISRLRNAGANRFVSGSAVFGSPEPTEALKELGSNENVE